MKRVSDIFVLSKSEQRVILIVMLVLVAVASLGYEQRISHPPVQPAATTESKDSASPVETEAEQ
jgi:hypothetical protein